MESVMVKHVKKQDVPLEMLTKEFLSQFKSQEDVSQFLKDLHTQVSGQMLQGEMDAHLGYEKHSSEGITAAIPVTGMILRPFLIFLLKYAALSIPLI